MKKMFTLAVLGLSICGGVYAQQGEEIPNDIMVYPNPATDQVVISGWSEGTAANIEIVNLDGKLVYQKQSVKHTLILNPRRLGLSKGVYFVSISTENGSETKKILVE